MVMIRKFLATAVLTVAVALGVGDVADAAPASNPVPAASAPTSAQVEQAVSTAVPAARTFSYTFTKATTAAMYSASVQGQAVLKALCGHLGGAAQVGCNLVADFAAHVLAGLGAPHGRCLQVFATWRLWPPYPAVGIHYVNC